MSSKRKTALVTGDFFSNVARKSASEQLQTQCLDAPTGPDAETFTRILNGTDEETGVPLPLEEAAISLVKSDSHVVRNAVSIEASVGGPAAMSRMFQLLITDAASDALQEAHQTPTQDTGSAASSHDDAPHDHTHSGFSDAPLGDEGHQFFAAVHLDKKLNNLVCALDATKIAAVRSLADTTADPRE
jgi:hypothetical protein